MTTIKPVGASLGSEEAEALYRQLHDVFGKGHRQSLRMNMSDVEFVRPSGVMSLITAARTWHHWTDHKVILAGMQQQVHAYLERINLFSACSDFIIKDSELPADQQFSRSQESRSVLEIMLISGQPDQNARDVPRAIKRVAQILRTLYGDSHSNIPVLCSLVSELASNIIHSQDYGHIMVQSYRDHAVLGGRVAIAIGDAGIGVERSLRSRPSLMRSVGRRVQKGSDFIQLSLEEGISSLNTVRGMGLSFVRKTVQDWKGVLTIRSVASRVVIPHMQPIAIEDNLPTIPGAQVTITALGVLMPNHTVSPP